jgi:hypothetical protein
VGYTAVAAWLPVGIDTEKPILFGTVFANDAESVLIHVIMAEDCVQLVRQQVGYRHRWLIELFFGMFRQLPGCRHLLSTTQNGVEIQADCAISPAY